MANRNKRTSETGDSSGNHNEQQNRSANHERSESEYRSNQPSSSQDEWREGFRGGYGNSGRMGRAAYNRGSFGAAEGSSERTEFGNRGDWNRGYEGGRNMESNEQYRGSWAEHAGPRGYSGSFAGRQYDWTTRGELQSANPGYDTAEERGPYSGRGPRGYTRSDQRVHEDICERMTEHGDLDASDIDVRCENGEVTLEGTVSDRRAKRLAEDIAGSARGVRDVQNRLRVASAEKQ